MSYEQLKTVSLISLIGLSLFLTYQLWTYQPNMQALESEQSESVQADDTIGEELDPIQLIKPDQVVLHQGANTYALIEKTSERYENLLREFTNHELIESVETEDVLASEGIEVSFPDHIPVSYLLRAFEGEFNTFSLSEVDRLFFYISSDTDQVNVQMASNQQEQVVTVRTSISADLLEEHLYKEDAEGELNAIIAKEIDTNQMLLRERIYVSTERQVVPSYSQYQIRKYEDVEISVINQRLFNSTDVPRQNQLNGENLYTDGSRIVTIDNFITYLNYSYPFVAESPESSSRHILDVAVEFINYTGAWTDDYALSNWASKETGETIDFRMQLNGLPVFERGMPNNDRMRISLSRVGTQVVNLQRPLFFLYGNPLQDYDKSMPSGEVVVESIKQANPTEWEESVTNVQLVYRANMENTSYATFEPTWYYESDGEWKRVPLDEEIPS